MKQYLLIFVALLMLVSAVAAVPVTGAASAIGPGNFTITCAGAVGSTWYQYGQQSDNLNLWTIRKTAVGGVSTVRVDGGTIYPSKTYYISACDSTGCDATPVSVTTTAFEPLTVITLGSAVTNMTESQFDLLYLPTNLLVPYSWGMPDAPSTAYTIVFGLLFLALYAGLWLRNKNVTIPLILGMLAGAFLMYADKGLRMGIPPEFSMIAQGLVYASMAAFLLSLLKK